MMNTIKIEDLKTFCQAALRQEGMREDYAAICAEVLVETDAWGTHSHGTKNLHNYIRKFRVGGADIYAEPEIVVDRAAFAIIDAHKALGMIPSYQAMNLACDKARQTGLGLVAVRNSCHFGAAGYYANMAAKRGMVGLSVSNVDPNMTAPGAKGMLIGNNPLAYAAPLPDGQTMFLDIAMSNVASLKVIQARKDGRPVPDTWIVDRDGLPTTDPSHYPEEGAMQPMAAHKGYGLAILVELLTGGLSGGGMSMMGDIVSWVFQLDKPNNVCHTFIAIDAEQFLGKDVLAERTQAMQERLHQAPKARGSTRIFTPGEIEWDKHKVAEEKGLTLPDDVLTSLQGLAQDCGLELGLY